MFHSIRIFSCPVPCLEHHDCGVPLILNEADLKVVSYFIYLLFSATSCTSYFRMVKNVYEFSHLLF